MARKGRGFNSRREHFFCYVFEIPNKKLRYKLNTNQSTSKGYRMDYTTKSVKELITICKERGIKGTSGKRKADLIELLKAQQQPQATPTTTKTNPPKSPLRYPGGKSRAVKILDEYITKYYPTRKHMLSPFFGGGSFEIHMRNKGYTVSGNDLFNPLYTFWQTQKTNPTRLMEEIRKKMPITKEKFYSLRETVCETTDPLDKASSYFLINRTSFSGATLCGGFSQEASTKRLTEGNLRTLAECNLTNISFTNLDCCVFLTQNPQTDSTLVYADPPYYIEQYIYGKNGDMHESFDHQAFATAIQKRKDWIVCYNDCPYIRDLYKGCRIFEVSWAYGMNSSKKSSEVLILPAAVVADSQS